MTPPPSGWAVALHADYPRHRECLPELFLESGPYRLRWAQDARDLDAVLRLRFAVFNLELGEGLAASYASGRDEDEFDRQCHHLLVEDRTSGEPVGTYRVQTAPMAAAGRGLYTAAEYDLAALPAEILADGIELGRACIARSHRKRAVLFLLWRGLASCVAHNRKRYLFGCCSLTSQDPRDGWAAFRFLKGRGLLWPGLWAPEQSGFACEGTESEGQDRAVALPQLFETYLRYGGRICGPPVIDGRFRTIDFLMLFDVEAMDPRSRRLFFEGL